MMDIVIFGSLYLDGVPVPHSPCPELSLIHISCMDASDGLQPQLQGRWQRQGYGLAASIGSSADPG